VKKKFDPKHDSIQIYDHDNLLQNAYNLIKKELSQDNIELIQKYDRAMVNASLSKATRHKHLKMILSLSRLLNKNWKDFTKEDIDELVFRIMERYGNSSGQETNTTWDHKKVLKIFFRWIRLGSREKEEVGDPPETKHVKIRKVKGKIVREDLLTEADRTRILHACGENARDRAFIDCHFEAGTRPGEILNLQIKHVKFDKNGAILHVDGKTGPRSVRLVHSIPSLAGWLAVHPFKDNPGAPLWPNISYRNYGEPLTYAAARSMIHRRCRMAHLSKRVYLNLFRHTEATITANFMTEAQMRKRHGWSAESKMPARYVHLVNADVDEAIFKHYGIKNDKKEKSNLPTICHVCDTPNPVNSKICSKCGIPLDLKTAIEIQEEEKIGREVQMKKIDELEKKVEELVEVISPSNSSKFLIETDEHKKQLLLQSLQKEHPVVKLDDTRFIIGKHVPAIFNFKLDKKT